MAKFIEVHPADDTAAMLLNAAQIIRVQDAGENRSWIWLRDHNDPAPVFVVNESYQTLKKLLGLKLT